MSPLEKAREREKRGEGSRLNSCHWTGLDWIIKCDDVSFHPLCQCPVLFGCWLDCISFFTLICNTTPLCFLFLQQHKLLYLGPYIHFVLDINTEAITIEVCCHCLLFLIQAGPSSSHLSLLSTSFLPFTLHMSIYPTCLNTTISIPQT